ncbi:MAG: sugar nucleotide-binding protein [Clostridia bacterium]|nr:sugar nucleotide-binding protein [Clostridia bacterium]
MKNYKTILVTGARGFVGARIMQAYPQAVAFPGELLRADMTVDANRDAIAAFIEKVRPDVTFPSAAISAIRECENNPDGSYQANLLMPIALAKAAQKYGVGFTAYSSDQVYTGVAGKGPYSEDMELPTPTNLYARHKLESENRILDFFPEAIFLRATWMYDMPIYGIKNRGNYPMNTLRAAMAGRELYCAKDNLRGLTYVRQVAENMEAVSRLPGGVYNYGSENDLSMTETTAAFLRTMGMEDKLHLIKEGGPQHDLSMKLDKLRSFGVVFDTTVEGFARCRDDYALL